MVLTGGSARMEGLVELAESIFQVPIRLGVPNNVSGLGEILSSPMYATGIGLLMFGMGGGSARGHIYEKSAARIIETLAFIEKLMFNK